MTQRLDTVVGVVNLNYTKMGASHMAVRNRYYRLESPVYVMELQSIW
jgi:hypothetical protein